MDYSRRVRSAIRTTLLPVFILAPSVLAPSGALNAQDVFVSPSGLDTNTGTSIDSPVRTFEMAAMVARSLGATGIVVQFAGGTYVFDATVVLDASYSGITFQAAPGATPVFTSLKRVTGWTSHTATIMKANSPLPAGSHVRYLQDTSENWMKRSETAKFKANETTPNPEDSYHEPTAQQNKLNVQHPPGFGAAIDWTKATQYDLRASQSGWNQEILRIASYDAVADRIFTQVPSNYEMRAHATEAIWPSENWVMNTIAGIDEPGEWAILDDVIYLYPLSGTNDIHVPQLMELIRVDAGGDGNTWAGTPVQNITFDGITMTGGDFYAYADGDVAITHDWDVVDKPAGLLRFRNAANSTITNCNFTKSGGSGLRLDRYAQNITISKNTFSFLGRAAISLIGRGPGYGDVNKNNTITGNAIRSIGREKWTSLAIALDQSSANLVSKNHIEDTYFSAIAVVAPKQFIFINHVFGTFNGTTWLGRDFHSREFEPSTYNTIPETPVATFDNGTWNAMVHLYSGNNTIENNAFVNTNSGQGYLVQSVIYISGLTRGQTTFVRNNYFFESTEATTNSSVIWADSDQDNTDWIGNMVNGIDINDNEPEPLPVYRANAHCLGSEDATLHDPGDRALIKANVTLDSMFSEHTSFDIADFRQLEGNQTAASGGDAAHASFYQTSWTAICPGIVAGRILPGASSFQTSLGTIITNSGGAVPTCPSSCSAFPDLVLTTPLTDPIVVYEACNSITAGIDYLILAGRDVGFRARNLIVFENDFGINSGATFSATLDPTAGG